MWKDLKFLLQIWGLIFPIMVTILFYQLFLHAWEHGVATGDYTWGININAVGEAQLEYIIFPVWFGLALLGIGLIIWDAIGFKKEVWQLKQGLEVHQNGRGGN